MKICHHSNGPFEAALFENISKNVMLAIEITVHCLNKLHYFADFFFAKSNYYTIFFFALFFRAIEIDSNNQVFYCNRAAAHSKMNNHYAAVEDCKRAIDMDPNYGKAYGRMGLGKQHASKK